MLFRKLIERKNTHVTWLLAIVIFLSAFSLSFSPQQAKTEHVKTKTELVLPGKIKSKKTTASYNETVQSSAVAEIQPPFTFSILCQNALVLTQFNEAVATRQDLIPALTHCFLFKIPEDNLAYPLG